MKKKEREYKRQMDKSMREYRKKTYEKPEDKKSEGILENFK